MKFKIIYHSLIFMDLNILKNVYPIPVKKVDKNFPHQNQSIKELRYSLLKIQIIIIY